MTYLQVDPGVIATVSARLLESASVAEQVRGDRDDLESYVDGEHGVVRGAVQALLDRWTYGCERIVEDATEAALRLDRASECYIEVEGNLTAGYRTDGP